MSYRIATAALAFFILFASCKRLIFEDDTNVVARIGKNKLYIQDVEKLITTPMTAADSAAFIANYSEAWVKRELKKQNAEKYFTDKTIEKMVDDYRVSLLTYKYEQRYTSSVSDEVSFTEISEYYNANKDNFLLSTPMVKARVLRIPAGYSNLKLIRHKMALYNADDMLDVASMAERDGLQMHDYTKRWHYFDEVVENMPFTYKNTDLDRFIENNKSYEVTSSDYLYLMQIYEHKKTGTVMPAEFLEGQIKKIIINDRKMKVLNHIEDSLYNKAVSDGTAFTRFPKTKDNSDEK